jgi:hypothetical protein
MLFVTSRAVVLFHHFMPLDLYIDMIHINFFSSTNLKITVFTKCKEYLHDGRRLGNISWRLWYCQFITSDSTRGERLMERGSLS